MNGGMNQIFFLGGKVCSGTWDGGNSNYQSKRWYLSWGDEPMVSWHVWWWRVSLHSPFKLCLLQRQSLFSFSKKRGKNRFHPDESEVLNIPISNDWIHSPDDNREPGFHFFINCVMERKWINCNEGSVFPAFSLPGADFSHIHDEYSQGGKDSPITTNMERMKGDVSGSSNFWTRDQESGISLWMTRIISWALAISFSRPHFAIFESLIWNSVIQPPNPFRISSSERTLPALISSNTSSIPAISSEVGDRDQWHIIISALSPYDIIPVDVFSGKQLLLHVWSNGDPGSLLHDLPTGVKKWWWLRIDIRWMGQSSYTSDSICHEKPG